MLSGNKKVIDMFSMIKKDASRVTAEANSSAYFLKSAILDHQSFEELIPIIFLVRRKKESLKVLIIKKSLRIMSHQIKMRLI